MSRFYQGYEWRWLVLAIDDPSDPELRIVTFLDGLALDAAYDRVLNDPNVINLTVPADSPEVNLIYTDGDPYVAEGTRVLCGLRRDNPGGSPLWRPRATGVLYQPRDHASVDSGAGNAYTDLAAMDPWQTLYRRPVCHFNGDLPSTDHPVDFHDEPADNVALILLFNTEAAHGPTLIDSSSLPGDELDPISITFERGLTVGEAWKALCDAGYMDIALDPVLDQAGGYISQLRIAEQIGEALYDVPFAWDGPGRNLAAIDRLEDGTLRTNKVQEYNGQGGPPLLPLTNYSSVAKYGEQWLIKAQAKTSVKEIAIALARTDLAQRAFGVTTINVSPMPERSAVPLLDYDIGDTVPVISNSGALRKNIDGTAAWRITRIPIRLPGSGLETVDSLEVSSDVELGT